MKRLILIAGLPGSGKSTIGQGLAERLGAEMVDIDHFKREVVDPIALTESIDPPEVRWQYYQRVLSHILGLFERGVENVVTDEMFHVRDLRERIENACMQRRISVLWVEVRCPDTEVARRLTDRPRKGHILSTEQMLRIRGEVVQIFEAFLSDLNHLTVSNTGPAEDAVSTALEWVRTR